MNSLPYLEDSSDKLGAKATETLRILLSEHEKLTGQQILFVIENQNRRPSNWQELSRGENVLIAVSTTQSTAQMDLGYGLDSVITQQGQTDILNECLRPAYISKALDRATACAAYRTLESLNSPLIESGKAAEILANSGIPSPFTLSSDYGFNMAWIVAGFAFVILSGAAMKWKSRIKMFVISIREKTTPLPPSQ